MSKLLCFMFLVVADIALAGTPELSVGSAASGITLVVGGVLIYLDMKRRVKEKNNHKK